MFPIPVLAEAAQSTSQLATADSNVLTSLGLDWGSFGFYLICFGITFFGLHRFLFKPMAKLIQSRRDQITENIDLQKTLKINLDELEHQRSGVRESMNNLRIETLESSKLEAKTLAEQITVQATSQAKTIITDATTDATNIKANAKSEIEKEVLAMWQDIITVNLKNFNIGQDAQAQAIEQLLKTPIK